MVDIDPSTIIKQGFLEKVGGSVHSWKKRYFILHNNQLDYFKEKGQTESLGNIPIIDCIVTIENVEDVEGPGFYFSLKIPNNSTAHRNYFLLRGITSDERASWIQAINSVNKITIFKRPLTYGLQINPAHPGNYLPIPYFIIQAVQYIEKNGLDIEGIYRLNGSQSQIDSYVTSINKNEAIEFKDVHSASGLIKKYMREFPEPILLFSNFEPIKKITTLSDDKQADAIRNVIRNLPIPNFLLLAYIFAHLRKILEHEETNKMNNRAIVVCIATSMIWAPEGKSSEAINESTVQQSVASILLAKYDEIFGNHPLFIYNSTGETSICKLVSELDDAPFALKAPKGSIVQMVANDGDGWTICVYQNEWGVVPNNCLTPVKGREAFVGLAKQVDKWTLTPEDLTAIGQKCPEAVALYENLHSKAKELRSRVARATGVA